MVILSRTTSSLNDGNYGDDYAYMNGVKLIGDYYGDSKMKERLAAVYAGKEHWTVDDIEKGSAITIGNTSYFDRGTVGTSLNAILNGAVLGQHESYRDGVKGNDNDAETLKAVSAHTEMAKMLISKYGVDWLNTTIVMDLIAKSDGEETFKEYVATNYSSEADFWKINNGKLKIENNDSLGKIAKELFGITAYENGQFTDEFKKFTEAIGFNGTNYGNIEVDQEFNLNSSKFKDFIRSTYKGDQEKLKLFDSNYGTKVQYNLLQMAGKGLLNFGDNILKWTGERLNDAGDSISGLFDIKDQSYLKNGHRYVKVNGVETEISKDTKIVYQLPVEGKGFKTYNPDGQENNPNLWGEKSTIKMLLNISKDWNKKFPDNPIFIGDINQAGGGATPGHYGYHADGLNFDIKFASIDGTRQPGNFFTGVNIDGSYILQTNYDQEKTKLLTNMFLNYDSRNWFQKMLNIGKSDISIKYIYYNDPEIQELSDLINSWDGHDNHLDLRYKLNL